MNSLQLDTPTPGERDATAYVARSEATADALRRRVDGTPTPAATETPQPTQTPWIVVTVEIRTVVEREVVTATPGPTATATVTPTSVPIIRVDEAEVRPLVTAALCCVAVPLLIVAALAALGRRAR